MNFHSAINSFMFFSSSLQCIAAGSHIAHHEWESNELRPYAVHLTECIQKVREALREQCKKDCETYPETVSDFLDISHHISSSEILSQLCVM